MAPAISSAWPGETGSLTSRTTTIATIATTMSTICFTSAQVTAWTPPIIVYATVGMPINATDHPIFQPKIAEITTAGAAMMVPHDIPRDSRNRNAVRERVLGSKRRSRYS